MDLLEFITQFSNKPKKHGDIWIYILIRLNQKTHISELLSFHKISKATLYRIFSLYNCDIKHNSGIIKILIKNCCIYSESSIIKKEVNKSNLQNKNKDLKLEIKSEDIYEIIINYLNQQSGKKYSSTSSTYRNLINSRIKEGYKVDDFKKVIDIKCKKWLKTSMEDYIRPQTLFSNKFEGYINETIIEEKKSIDKANDTINKAKQFDWKLNN
jgi:uncharacterized phage protein (TIGR02220 family)